jgi:hypothetical protein
MRVYLRILFAVSSLCVCGLSHAVLINFDDVEVPGTDITGRYASQGVTLNAIANPFIPELFGPFPAPATLPTILGGVHAYFQGFESATSPPHVAVSGVTAQTEAGQPGNGGILISFAFDVSSVSLVGNDLGGATEDDEDVTLTAYNALGKLIGQVFSDAQTGLFDQTPAAISLLGIRYVAFNYTNTPFGFYAIDDLQFLPQQPTTLPEPGTLALLSLGLLGLAVIRRRKQ